MAVGHVTDDRFCSSTGRTIIPTCEQIYWLVHVVVQSMMYQVIDSYIEE